MDMTIQPFKKKCYPHYDDTALLHWTQALFHRLSLKPSLEISIEFKISHQSAKKKIKNQLYSIQMNW